MERRTIYDMVNSCREHGQGSPVPNYCQGKRLLGILVFASIPGKTHARKIPKNETFMVRCQGIEVVVGWTSRPVREPARDEGPGVFVCFDEDEPPVATIGGVLLQYRLAGRAAPGERIEDQRVGVGGDS